MSISEPHMWELADGLMITLKVDKEGRVHTEGTHRVDFDGVTIPIKMKCLSSRLGKDWSAVLVRIMGNLVAFAHVGHGSAKLTVVLMDIAKMPAVERILETSRPATPGDFVTAHKAAVVGTYSRSMSGFNKRAA